MCLFPSTPVSATVDIRIKGLGIALAIARGYFATLVGESINEMKK
jgi:hypothetical protein